MALLDAQLIADAIEEGKDWDDVWCRFHAQRAGSIRFYQIMSWLLTPLFQSRIPGAAFILSEGSPNQLAKLWVSVSNAEYDQEQPYSLRNARCPSPQMP